ncbi:MAG TPA: CHAT domain-containing tetratricopeptide repeat protein, partial [Blastocatellia bacterium]|nr:CHAT domain-containing tetratricopeptide repeat protein [Blastocatellia bacterium]
ESREAAFNRALCFQRLLLTIAAIEGFNRVAELEGDSGWAKEARVRIEELSRPLNARLSEGAIREAFDAALAGGNVEEARRISDENFEVLTKYALLDLTIDHLNAAISGDSHKSETALGKIEAIGRFFVEIKEDRFIADLAEYHRKLPEKERPAELRLINDYQEAVAATRSHIANEKQAAFDRLSRLASVFRARGNPVRAERAEIRVAVFHYESNKLRTSLEVIARVLPLVEQNDWKFEQAWVFGHIALVQAKLGRDSQALKYCDRAIAITERMREMAQVAKHLQTLSMTYRRLGDLDRALDNYRKSLRLILSKSPQPAEIAFNYFDIANIYRKQRNHKLALLYAEQALINCDRSKDANRFAQVTTLQALEQSALQHTVQARLSLSRALEIIPDLDPGKRAFTEPLILSQAGEIALVLGDIQEAIDYFTRAELLASKSEDNRFLLINSVSGRAAAYARRNQIERARSDVARMIDIIESYRAGIAERKYRSSFLESSQNAFDQAISLNLASFGNPVEAFNLSERARARALLDEITIQKLTPWDKGVSTPASPLDIANSLKLDKVQAALPEGLTMVKYSVSESQTYIFVVRRSGFDVRLSSATSETLDMLVRRYLAGLRSLAPMEQLKEQARDLYDHLIKPIKGTIPQNSNVCIVPDKALHFLPFAALVDESGDYLIRSYNLSYAPSASVLAHCFEREKNKPTDGRERIVAVGNPAFDRERYKDLSPLPEADVETSESAGYYQERVILRDRDATEQSVLAAMKQCDVAHLATHCLVEEKSPWLAAL